MSVSSVEHLNKLSSILYDRPASRNIIGHAIEEILQLRAEVAAAREKIAGQEAAFNSRHDEIEQARAEVERLRALLSSARLAMRICIPKPSCHSIDVIAQIDEAIGEAGVHCSAGRGEGEK